MANSNYANLEQCIKLTSNTCTNLKNTGKCQRKLLTFSNMLLFERKATKNIRDKKRVDFNLLDEIYLYIVGEKSYFEHFHSESCANIIELGSSLSWRHQLFVLN